MVRNLMMIAMAIALGVMSSTWLTAQDGPKVETVVEGLNNPCGIAIQPETGHVFVADSGGLRVVRVVDGKIEDVITEFPKDIYGKGPMYDIGPLGLAFLDKDTLVVGGGGLIDGEDLLRTYKVPAAGSPAIKASEMVNSFKLTPTDEIKGEGNFYALAVTSSGVYVTCNGDDTKGWVAKATLSAGTITEFKRNIATKEATEVDAPVGITVSPEGFLAVGQMGEITIPNDSLLTFYDEASGKMMANFRTNLSDITAVAYSPQNRLYALDFAWHDTSKGGLFKLVRIEGNTEECKAVEVTKLDKPTAMVFDKEGNAFVTVIGTKADGATAPAGKLLKISGIKEDTNPSVDKTGEGKKDDGAGTGEKENVDKAGNDKSGDDKSDEKKADDDKKQGDDNKKDDNNKGGQ